LSTLREQILEATHAALATVPGVHGGVWRSRKRAFTVTQSPGVLLYPADEAVELLGTGVARRTLTLRLELIGRETEKLSADQVLDPVAAAIHARLFAALLSSLVPVNKLFESRSEWAFSDANHDACVLHLEYFVHYETQEEDLTTPP
jgi:hypothetical protein